ncbi:MAG: capsular polysaccharide export protein, LipB/KpsS family [Psychroflexus halocasei]|uniref:capsular polysaccharide export protein, LipB/KpsS family n=1 Tax=Psychroflexus sp. S27 TaxID=1982757 RepID=UPI000C2B40B7|nr:hypothetical protein [Psychroflexus sp. S27]PJX20795.1 hypothetical protein CAP47_11190 [Psychroflexus sp. S27]
MKLLCVGYYDKFSRFFIGIHKELKKKLPESEIKIASLYTSGFLYSFIRFYSSINISFKVWCKVLINYKSYKKQLQKNQTDFDLDKLISYKLKENKNVNVNNLKLQALACIEVYTKIFNSFQPDVLCCVGDSRLAIKIAVLIAKKRNIPCHFIEIGPFGTTIFDAKGVNANASINNKSLISRLPKSQFKDPKEVFNQIKINDKKYKRSPIYRGIDYALGALFNSTKIYPPDLKYQHSTFNGEKKSIKSPLKENKFLLIGQVTDDVNMSYHSPNFDSFENLLKTVYQNLPENSSLTFREHPHFTGKHSKDFYSFMKENHINLDNKTLLNELIESHDVVVVNNSTVGLESIAEQKSVVVLANAYYALPELCLQLKNKDELKAVLKQTLSFKPSTENVTKYFDFLLNSYFIEGRLVDENLKSAKNIAHILIKKHD